MKVELEENNAPTQESQADSLSAFERAKWIWDRNFRKRELALKRREFLVALWTVVAGLIGTASTVTYNSVRDHLTLEAQRTADSRKDATAVAVETEKGEQALLLEAIKASDLNGTTERFRLFLDAWLIATPERRRHIASYLKQHGFDAAAGPQEGLSPKGPCRRSETIMIGGKPFIAWECRNASGDWRKAALPESTSIGQTP